MSQGARTKLVIGSATPLRSRTPRTLTDAFGPAATYRGLMRESRADRVDRLIGRFCFAIVIAAVLALIVNAAFSGV